jgi:hypothetical protein
MGRYRRFGCIYCVNRQGSRTFAKQREAKCVLTDRGTRKRVAARVALAIRPGTSKRKLILPKEPQRAVDLSCLSRNRKLL